MERLKKNRRMENKVIFMQQKKKRFFLYIILDVQFKTFLNFFFFCLFVFDGNLFIYNFLFVYKSVLHAKEKKITV